MIAASATKIAVAQRNYGNGGFLALAGAASDAVATTVCASQSPAAAAFTINGSRALNGVAYLGAGAYIYITFAGDSHTITVAVVGKDVNNAIQTETITGANAQVVGSGKVWTQIISMTPSGAVTGAITVGSYTVSTLDVTRKLLFTTTADESANTATIIGTNWGGSHWTETLTLVNNSTVQSVLDYKTVTSVQIANAAAGNISLGTNGVAASPWVYLDAWSMSQIGIQCNVSGTANYTLQQTLDDPTSPTNAVAAASVVWISTSDTALVGATTSLQSNYAYPPTWARVLLNSSSGTGFVTATFTQALSAVL